MKYLFIVVAIILFVFLFRLLGSLKGLNRSVKTISDDTNMVSKGLEESALKMEYSKAVRDKVWNKGTKRTVGALSLVMLTLKSYFKEDKSKRSLFKSVAKTVGKRYIRLLR